MSDLFSQIWPLVESVISIRVRESEGRCIGMIRKGLRCRTVGLLGNGLCQSCWDHDRTPFHIDPGMA